MEAMSLIQTRIDNGGVESKYDLADEVGPDRRSA